MMVGIIYTLTAFFLMEGVAWFTHKHIMHRFLWSLHKDHHLKTHNSFWERNDFFFLIFALPGIFLIWKGVFHDISILLNIGIGIALYGFAYFVIHDIFIHQRLPVFKKSKNLYLQALRKAHKVHHKHLSKYDGECFGMLLVPLKYYTEARKIKK
jgi:beta-carotene 3-hydroxylase